MTNLHGRRNSSDTSTLLLTQVTSPNSQRSLIPERPAMATHATEATLLASARKMRGGPSWGSAGCLVLAGETATSSLNHGVQLSGPIDLDHQFGCTERHRRSHLTHFTAPLSPFAVGLTTSWRWQPRQDHSPQSYESPVAKSNGLASRHSRHVL